MDIDLKTRRAEIVIKVLTELFPSIKPALRYVKPYEFLIAVILSAQCTDKKVNEVTAKLFKKYPTLESYTKADFAEFCMDIRQTGFYTNKAKNVLATTKRLLNEHAGVIPKTMQDLMQFPGVARKTASVVLGELYRVSEGIAVDTHVIRLSQKFGLTEHTNAEKIEKDLMQILPRKEWREFTLRMAEYGRQYSPAHKKDDRTDPVTKALIAENLL
ncbi:MAG: endonuclease III [Candidatus Moraniibacteriota bacterium]|nr:MAG: endonuclease III [Candidatus Moranbacteria bacterium]